MLESRPHHLFLVKFESIEGTLHEGPVVEVGDSVVHNPSTSLDKYIF